jgi:hypothetical protein
MNNSHRDRPRAVPDRGERSKRPAPPPVSQRELVEASLLRCPPQRRNSKRA